MPLSRRRFLQSGLEVGLAASAAWVTGCGPEPARVSPEAEALHRESLVLDLHLDTLLSMRFAGYDITARHTNRLPRSPFTWHMDVPRAREGGLDAAVMGLVINPREVREELMGPLRCSTGYSR